MIKHITVDSYELWRYFYGDEETRGKHDRHPTETYAVWVRDCIDPDAEHADVPPRLLMHRRVQGITLFEHLLFHLKYFRETGQLLDRNAFSTLCLGSRDSGGCIPCVSGWHSVDGKPRNIRLSFAMSRVRVREVVA
jgi:hypothetical protein